MSAAALVISIVAFVATLAMWLVDKGGRDRDRNERREERDQDRADREADRRERHAERNDVVLDVAWVTREGPAGRAQYWWRLRLVGGTAFSRATVNYLRMHHRGNSPEVWEPLHSEQFPLTIGAGQTVYLPGYEPSIADTTVPVRAEWAPDGEELRMFERALIDQPD